MNENSGYQFYIKKESYLRDCNRHSGIIFNDKCDSKDIKV